MDIFEKSESNVRNYCRSFPDVFYKAKGSILYAESGKEYIDFFAGAGALNYGHNNDSIQQQIIAYLMKDGIIHGLDMYTSAKREFIKEFYEDILAPRKLDYKIQFCGPTGTNAVEAALKLARKVKQRIGIFSFMGGYHGVSQGSLAVTGNLHMRAGAGVPLSNVTFMPYPFGFMATLDTIQYIENVLTDPNSGIEKPAAIILETVQAEGGVIVAPVDWLQRIEQLCKKHDILLICDEIQVGCDRTGTYFSFERAGINPDIVLLSKSISGLGLPMSILLMKPEYDIWEPGEHSGTFRGNQLAFIGATAALGFRKTYQIETEVKRKEEFLSNYLRRRIASLHDLIHIRGIGMIWGIDLSKIGGYEAAKYVTDRCFKQGLVVEKAGRNDTAIKLLPPLTTEDQVLERGCSIIRQAIEAYLSHSNGEMVGK